MSIIDRIRDILYEENITLAEFENGTGIDRKFLYRKKRHKPHKSTLLVIAYFLNMPLETLVEGTDMEDEV